jgi:HD-GYP domain-containing protein (c-di-GMP phosphodiesterase class II)
MFVAELDRSWLHTPFSGPGLIINSPEQAAALAHCCRYVYVDPVRSDPSLPLDHRHAADATRTHGFDAARRALDDAMRWVTASLREARTRGRVDIAPLRHAAHGLTRQVSTRQDACLWLIATDTQRSLLPRRALGSAVLAIAFGLRLGFNHRVLVELALGGLLMDIGKAAVPVTLLAAPRRLNDSERVFVNRHVQSGLALIRTTTALPEQVGDMVLGHHERLDGSGYPRRLRGTEIPLAARLAGIVDTFDAMTMDRRYAASVSGHDALRYLNSRRDEHFDAALVATFIHAIGVYPTGTRVELADGHRGVVCAQGRDSPLTPLVLVLEDRQGSPLPAPRLSTGGSDVHVARALAPGALRTRPLPMEPAVAALH